jgi:general secretion pathway protein D
MPIYILTKLPRRCLAIAVPVMMAGALLAQDYGKGSATSDKELERRMALVQEGQMLLLKGDESYSAGNYKEASEAYAGARNAFPDAKATADLREAATRRFALASVEYGRELLRKGDVAAAKAAVDKVLEESVSPDDPIAKPFRAQLDDPIRNNPALTKEHADNVDEVRRRLYTAQAAFDLGKFDEAQNRYKDVLRIDPYNKAARRGMELVAVRKSSYLDTARDDARANALAEVGAAWELSLKAEPAIPVLPDMGEEGSGSVGFVPVSNKVSRIVIPEFNIVQGTLLDALDLLRLRATENDKISLDPERKGINIAVNLGDSKVSPAKEILAKTFDLRVNNVPVDAILKYIVDITGTSFRADDYAVTISPAGQYSDELVSRSYRVSPDFLSNLSAGSNVETQSGDIFNTEIGKGGLLATRMGAEQALANQGITFPSGASATFNPTSNSLRVVNTPGNLDVIEQIIDSISQTEPVSVAVRVTMLKVEREQLEELGFDWMLNSFGFGDDGSITGADQLNLTGGTTGSGTAITDITPQPGTTFPTNPITAGNRSGDGAFTANSIDSLIAAGSTGGRQASNRAPGVLGINGVVRDATVQMLMRGLNQKKGVDLMSQPSVTTRSGQAASIKVVDEFIYPTEYDPPELPQSGGGGITIDENGNIVPVADAAPATVIPATPTAFEKRDVGISLEVLPVADANRRFVNVTLNPVVTDFDGFVNYGSPINATSTSLFGSVTQELTANRILMPVFSVRRANTNVVVADGSTIVVGGLLKDEISNVNDKTPILGDLPVVGRLFQSDAKKHQSIAIMFLVNVELLDPMGRPYRDR